MNGSEESIDVSSDSEPGSPRTVPWNQFSGLPDGVFNHVIPKVSSEPNGFKQDLSESYSKREFKPVWPRSSASAPAHVHLNGTIDEVTQDIQLPISKPIPVHISEPVHPPQGAMRMSQHAAMTRYFVGGIGNAKQGDIYHYFRQFGKIKSICIKKDPRSGMSKGFGFVEYRLPPSHHLQRRRFHTLPNGMTVDVKPAIPYDNGTGSSASMDILNIPEEAGDSGFFFDGIGESGYFGERTRGKVFLGGTQGLTENDLQEELYKFGPIKVLRIMKNPGGKPKGFGFVTFEDENAADDVIEQGNVIVKGKTVYALPAIDKSHLASNPPPSIIRNVSTREFWETDH